MKSCRSALLLASDLTRKEIKTNKTCGDEKLPEGQLHSL